MITVEPITPGTYTEKAFAQAAMRTINRLVEAAREIDRLLGQHQADIVELRRKKPGLPGAGTTLQLYRVHAIHAYWLECYTASYDDDGTLTIGTTLTNVARPPGLRPPLTLTELSIPGETAGLWAYTYSAATGEETDPARDWACTTRAARESWGPGPVYEVTDYVQSIFPAWSPDSSLILAANVTGSVKLPAATPLGIDPLLTPAVTVDWIDLNIDARQWVNASANLRVCVGGNKRRIRWPYSTPFTDGLT